MQLLYCCPALDRTQIKVALNRRYLLIDAYYIPNVELKIPYLIC